MQFLLYIFHQLPHGTQKRKIIMRPTQGSRSRRIDLQECKKAHQKLRERRSQEKQTKWS
ncbi:PREDICTED: uncharacterized protein LOC105143027 isoform X2 [Acromyrmex echinatior]|uniref:uncharacterized protein LOC105143027 isoform X2 n=1 Tax=Acromyrmex echinatior TaxID=103372 RepID=UPI000580F041|nr:PREDICTED: uncharacterized protein LOC105143027 isoform X2 [Acromyrmex echinatior]